MIATQNLKWLRHQVAESHKELDELGLPAQMTDSKGRNVTLTLFGRLRLLREILLRQPEDIRTRFTSIIQNRKT
jgi:hypothetical protein